MICCMVRKCTVKGCIRKHSAKGYCNTHYERIRRNGMLETKVRVYPKHNMRDAPEMNAYWKMVLRCNNPKDKAYEHYGGRGIKVCDRWLESPFNFFDDVGMRPSKYHSLDRIDVDGDYEPKNVRWATRDIQATNKRVISNSNTSGYVGVSKEIKRGNIRWRANITCQKKRQYSCRFKTKKEAALWYNQMATLLHGANAKLNTII